MGSPNVAFGTMVDFGDGSDNVRYWL